MAEELTDKALFKISYDTEELGEGMFTVELTIGGRRLQHYCAPRDGKSPPFFGYSATALTRKIRCSACGTEYNLDVVA